MKPPCPVCVAEVDEVQWSLARPRTATRGNAFGYVPMDVITLQPCGHELKLGAMVRYRERMEEMQSGCGCPWNNGYKREPLAPSEHRIDCPEFVPVLSDMDFPPF